MILCCGEALIDMIPIRSAEGEEGFAPHCGGAIFNTAISLGRLGVPSALLTGLSKDMFGDQLADALEASRVDSSFAIRLDRPTTLAFVRLTDGHASYTFYDENTAMRSITPGDLPDLPGQVSALYFGGISLCSLPAADTYVALAEREAPTRAIMLDPNIRSSFIHDEAAYRARLDRMIALADIVKVSDEDLDWIIPGSDPLETKLAQLQARGPSVAIMTRGSEGALALLPSGGSVSVPAQKAKVADTVGAGDTFNAGVLARLHALGALGKATLQDMPPEVLEQALAHGARVAAITVSRAGANPPWASELTDD